MPMENAKKVLNVRGTLRAMQRGSSVILYNVRGSSLRQSASVLREVGMQFRVNKTEGGYKVTREV